MGYKMLRLLKQKTNTNTYKASKCEAYLTNMFISCNHAGTVFIID